MSNTTVLISNLFKINFDVNDFTKCEMKYPQYLQRHPKLSWFILVAYYLDIDYWELTLLVI
jgi:hypothetical protein